MPGARRSTKIAGAAMAALLLAVAPGAARAGGARARAAGNGFTQSFRSAPSLRPPIVSTSGRDPDPQDGDIFTDAQNSIQAGPVILNPEGQLVWFEPLTGGRFASDVTVQRYRGQSVLTYWQGHGGAQPVGEGVILDHHYRTVAVVHPSSGYVADNHEFTITPRGTALLSAYRIVHANLSPVGGPRHGKLIDSTIQEIDIATGRLVWQWQAYGHVPVADSYAGKPGRRPYDFLHLNSIQQLPDGNLLVSARHTWTVYEIDKRTGSILWELGGKHSSFTFGPGARFEWQHDARMQPDGTITLLDNGAGSGPQHERQSRALRLRLDLKSHRATLLDAYINDPALLSSSQGSAQILPDRNVLVGWGTVPNVTEFSSSGRQLFSVYFHSPLQTYRAFRRQWWGQPAAPPGISVKATRRGTDVYASWNGDTEVRAWRVLAGPGPGALKAVKRFPRANFETRMSVRSKQPFFAVQALGRRGKVLGTSATAKR
jgi:Arylsulfotransferase (ASST)